MQRNRKIRLGVAIAVVLLLIAVNSAGWLVLDRPEKSDAILVLAGETEHRPALGLDLLLRGYGRLVILDVPADTRMYQWTQAELAQKWVQSLPEATSIKICPIQGLSTKDEAEEAAKCLADTGSRKVLLVTSDFHTRRALSIFRTRIPQFEYSVAAAHDPKEFGVRWWQQREWAKTNFYEWLRLIWWELVDRWR